MTTSDDRRAAAVLEYLGPLLDMLDPADKRPAREQFNAKYPFGGWQPIPRLRFDAEDMLLHYPGDPPQEPIATTKLRDETIVFYMHALVAIVQPDGSFEVARLD